jgi:hypothetical protein
MSVRWIALANIFQGYGLAHLMLSWHATEGPSVYVGYGMMVAGLILEWWPGKRWTA